MNEPRQTNLKPFLSRTAHVIQGDFEASSDPSIVLTTLLGSCVCTCLCDPVAEIGGMNHFLLPDSSGHNTGKMRYGLHAMELLINKLMKLGAKKDRLEAKIFGGARMYDGLGSIGDANAAFALNFLSSEGICVVGHSLGGILGRRIRYWPTTGKAQQMFLQNYPSDAPKEKPIISVTESNRVTYFD